MQEWIIIGLVFGNVIQSIALSLRSEDFDERIRTAVNDARRETLDAYKRGIESGIVDRIEWEKKHGKS